MALTKTAKTVPPPARTDVAPPPDPTIDNKVDGAPAAPVANPADAPNGNWATSGTTNTTGAGPWQQAGRAKRPDTTPVSTTNPTATPANATPANTNTATPYTYTPPPPTKTLSAYLAANNQTIDDLTTNSWMLSSAATALLNANGMTGASESQVLDATNQLQAAIKSGNWKDFHPTVETSAIPKQDGINERLNNVFGEKRVYSEQALTAQALKLQPYEQNALNGGYETGLTGRVMAGSFIHTGYRIEGDFSDAYGDPAWKGLVRATTYLDSIPKGTFVSSLNTETIRKTNELIFAPDLGVKAEALRLISAVGRGGEMDKGGQFRTGNQYGRPVAYTPDQIKAMEEAGIQVDKLKGGADGKVTALLKYPPAAEIQPRLQKLIDGLKSDLAKPDADPIGAASNFQRRFVALHPFGDSNGRTSRALMNRVLEDFDLPPAIFKDQDNDVDMMPDAWRRQVAEGCAHTKDFIATPPANPAAYVSEVFGLTAFPKADNEKPVMIGGNPFERGQDGLLYDPTGRPYLAQGKELVPMSQLDHYLFSRRLGQLGPEAGTKKMTELTQGTRDLFDAVAKDPKAGEGITVRSDQSSRKADEQYRLSPQPEIAKMLTGLADISKVDSKVLLHTSGTSGMVKSQRSDAMSRYAQVDLELWYLQQGLENNKQPDLAKNVRDQRSKLFTMAKKEVDGAKDETRVTKDNPMGFQYRYEKLMYEKSPLRFDTLGSAISHDGDSKMTVWRGDYSIARVLGMAPNNDRRQPDAKQIAKERSKHEGVTDLYDDLSKLEGSAIGRQYISTTSNLELLTGQFANGSKSQEVNVDKLPHWVKGQLFDWVERGEKKDATTGKPEVTYGGDVHREMKDVLKVPGEFLDVAMKDKNDGSVTVTAPRKAFRLELPREALLPGLRSLGGGFENEQEAHGLERVTRGEIKEAYESDTLNQMLPTKAEADAAALKAATGKK